MTALRCHCLNAPMNDMSHRFTLTGVSADDLPPERQEQALSEVRFISQVFEAVWEQVEPLHDVELDVALVENLDERVDRVMTEHGRFETVGPYRSARNAVVAHAITLRDPRQAHVRATIVMNHVYWLLDGAEPSVWRTQMLAHELGHVRQQACGTSADWRRHHGPPASHDDNLRRAALVLWEEFGADVFSFPICKAMFRDENEKPIPCAPLFGMSFVETACTLLDRLCVFTRDVVGADGVGARALYIKGASLLGESLLTLAHAAAAFHVDDRLAEMTATLNRHRGFRAYLADIWEPFLTQLRKTETAAAAEEPLIELMDRALRRLGLVIANPLQGFRVALVPPVLCEKSGTPEE
jgi:hypothetical protein